MKNSFVIFICTFDPFKEGRHQYTFQNSCIENPNLLLGDDTTKVFLNTKGIIEDVDDEMMEFLAYIEDSTDAFALHAKSPLVKEVHKKVTAVKHNKELEAEYMTLLQRDRENIEIGRKQGEQKMAMLIKQLIEANRFEDLKQATDDIEYRKKLFKDFMI